MKVLMGDRFGRILGEITPQIDSISWILNREGKTKIIVSRNSNDFDETLLRVGNRIYIDPENGLPPWGGVVDLPRTWPSFGVVLSCYGIESAYQTRVTDKNAVFYNQQAGDIFRLLIQREETKDPLGVTIGSIWQGGKPHGPRYNHMSMWDVLDYSIRRMERCDFRFTPYLADGYIRFRADFYQIAGSNKTASVSIQEGRNAGAATEVEELGTLINTHYAIGEGSVWDQTRMVTITKDLSSISKYGLRESAQIYSGTSMQSTLEMQGRNVIRLNSEARRYFRLPVSNNSPGAFADYDLGDVIGCKLPSFGFSGYDHEVRVLARDFSPSNGSCELLVEEQNEPQYWIYQEDLDDSA